MSDIRMEEKRTKRRKRPDPDTHKAVSKWNALIFFGAIIVLDIIFLFSHGRLFSENENRMLQQAPQLTMQSLTSGRYMTQFESFISDQFAGRDGWIGAKLKMDRILGKKESNGVYLGGQGYLIEATAEPDTEALSRNLEAINQFAAGHPRMKAVMTIVPNSSEINHALVPAGAPIRSQSEDMAQIMSQLSSDVVFADLLPVLTEHKSEPLYYRSDHHWTSLGASYAFPVIAQAMGFSEDDHYEIYQVADDFSGTMAATSGDFQVTDPVEIYIAQPEADYYVEYSGDPVKYSSVYSSAALENKNKYEVFFGGNHPKITITTMSDTGRNLLVLKDSYANCFIPFLLPHFDHIMVVDPRYYSDDLETDLQSADITDLLILYNENTFVEDQSLAGVIAPDTEV